MSHDEKQFFDKVVHGLRMNGWSRIEAEYEALNRIGGHRQWQDAITA